MVLHIEVNFPFPHSIVAIGRRLAMMELVVDFAKLSAALLCIGSVAAHTCAAPAQTTLATFNSALIAFYPGLRGQPDIEDRASLLIQQVLKSDDTHVLILCDSLARE